MADDAPTPAAPKRLTKAAMLRAIAEITKLTQKQVDEVFESLMSLIVKELSEEGPGEFTLPGLLTLKATRKPATPERQGRNPFKPGEQITIKAKPARMVVRIRALKPLTEQIE